MRSLNISMAAAKPLSEALIFKINDTILFGKESAGVPKNVHDNSYEKLKITLKKNMRSLNISITAAITLAEALKQNKVF